MNEIGGYFELELAKGKYSYHGTTHSFKSGRSSLHYILSVTRPSLVYIPYYTCDVLLESFEASGTSYKFYEINSLLEPIALPELKEDEYFLYTNYFDIKRDCVSRLSATYADKLIVDCTQAFFLKGDGRSWFFNSCRKFFGVPDGSFLYAPGNTTIKKFTVRNEEYIIEHLLKRFNGHTGEGYELFLRNEVLCGSDIKGISRLSEHLLSHVDYEAVAAIRQSNYFFLDNNLKSINLFETEPVNDSVPMFYPLLLAKDINRELLYAENIFVPTLWKDVLTRCQGGYSLERSITNNLFPLPVDHRYSSDDMERMVSIINRINE